MKTAPLLLLPLLLLSLATAFCAERPPLRERVNEFIAKYKTPEAIDARLREWSAQEPENPDPYILASNAYLAAAEHVQITADKKQGGIAIAGNEKDGFAIVDPKTSQRVGTIAGGTDPKMQMKGEAILAIAAEKFPQRLDIHVGRLSICERAGDIAALEKAVAQMLAAVAQQGEKMRWIDGAPLESPLEEKVVGEIHGRIAWLYRMEKPEGDEGGHNITLAALKLYPKNVKLLNDAALYHAYREEWAKAREQFIKASETDPKDLLIRHNVAMASLRMGDRDDARKRWEAIIKQAPKSEDATKAKEEIRKMDAAPEKKPK